MTFTMSNPIATAAVSAVLDRIVKVEPPRSWGTAERSEWARLPPTIRETITRREKDRDVALKRKFNELAELKKRQTVADETELSPTPKENGNDQTTQGY